MGEPTGRRRALLVGCNYPGQSAELNGCINDVLEWDEERFSYPELLSQLHEVLESRSFVQRPRLSSSQAFCAEEKIFSFTEGMVPNMNPVLGQAQAAPKKQSRPNAEGFQW